LSHGKIAVLIPAYNAEATIALAIQSALLAKHVAEVFVVDDCSTDRTIETALSAGGGDPRLTVVQQKTNMGPSAARNRALLETKSPLISILDADDYLMPKRFENILLDEEWDLCADNIVFVSNISEIEECSFLNSAFEAKAVYLSLEHFVYANISSRDQQNRELGFLKPVMKRSFLEKYNLTYPVDCRLGEDFILYAKALAHGARFKVWNSCGYAALVRNNSLSNRHTTQDLMSLHEKCVELLVQSPLTTLERKSLSSHAKSVLHKIHHRQVLDVRRRKGIIAGTLFACRHPLTIIDLLRDRLAPVPTHIQTPHMLFSFEEWAKFGD
jgi:succinoglycan biosynthesis protein ExoU